MKLSCEITADLLPLYEDNVCSEESRRAVAEHLQECGTCRALLQHTHSLPALDLPPEKIAADKIATTSFKKIRFRWFTSLLLVIFLLPMCILMLNQCFGWSIHFTNLHELYIGHAFMRQLQTGNYEKAYQYLDVQHKKEEWLVTWFAEETLANIKTDGLQKFCEAAKTLEDAGGIQEYQYIGILKSNPLYELIYTVTIAGEKHEIQIDISDSGIRSFSCDGSFLNDPFAHFSMWSEWLWEDYAGCYFDPETGQYIYFDTD